MQDAPCVCLRHKDEHKRDVPHLAGVERHGTLLLFDLPATPIPTVEKIQQAFQGHKASETSVEIITKVAPLETYARMTSHHDFPP